LDGEGLLRDPHTVTISEGQRPAVFHEAVIILKVTAGHFIK